MTTVKLYGIKNCGTMRAAKVFLTEHKIKYDFIDYKKTPPDAELIQTFFDKLGWEQVMNRKGLTWRKLSAEQRADIDEAKALELLVAYPNMLKRPIISQGDKYFVGLDDLENVI